MQVRARAIPKPLALTFSLSFSLPPIHALSSACMSSSMHVYSRSSNDDSILFKNLLFTRHAKLFFPQDLKPKVLAQNRERLYPDLINLRQSPVTVRLLSIRKCNTMSAPANNSPRLGHTNDQAMTSFIQCLEKNQRCPILFARITTCHETTLGYHAIKACLSICKDILYLPARHRASGEGCMNSLLFCLTLNAGCPCLDRRCRCSKPRLCDAENGDTHLQLDETNRLLAKVVKKKWRMSCSPRGGHVCYV
jgi:hypothetical protein